MLHNYIKTAFRNLLRNKTQATVNIMGLVVGFSAFLLIFLVVQNEESFDNFHANKERIYRVVRENATAGASFPLAAALKAEYPQVEAAAGIYGDRNVQVLVQGDAGKIQGKFKEHSGVFFADPQFFDLFRFRQLAGAPAATSISEPNTVWLARNVANRYFGNWQKAMGKTIRAYNRDIKVTGILDDPPANTDFPLGLVISYATLPSLGIDMQNWVELSDFNYCFIRLQPAASVPQMDVSLQAFLSRHAPPGTVDYRLKLQPLNDMHLNKRYSNFNGRVFGKDLVAVLRLIALFLLIIACVNFINLSTANAVNRSREVGVRKVLGSSRRQLLFQFFGETGLTCLLALLLAVVVSIVILPFLNTLLGTGIRAAVLYQPAVLFFLLLAWLIVTAMAGIYPALVLSAFNPVTALKNRMMTESGRHSYFRRALVTFQFVIAQALIIGTLIVVGQMNYFRSADMGFSKEAIVHAAIPGDSVSRSKMSLLRDQLLLQPGVRKVSFSTYAPVGVGGWATDCWLHKSHGPKPDLIVQMKPADTAYFSLYQLQLLAGRVYQQSDTIREFVVNEKLLEALQLGTPQEAIGKNLLITGTMGPIVGVVKDFHTNSLREPLQPVVMTTIKLSYRMVNIKIAPGKAREVLTAMGAIWNKTYPDYVFEYNFIDDTVAAYYHQEKQLAQLYQVFAGIAVFISCLGLYGLISFMAVRRKKEIGIRKVLGAPAVNILLLLSREFTMLITLAFFIAAPVAWYWMHQWLQQYAFKIHLGMSFFLAAFLASVFIAWLTVGYTVMRAASANPVNSLHTE